MEFVILIISMLVGVSLYGLHRLMRKNIFKALWNRDDLWFAAAAKPVFLRGEGVNAEWVVPLEIEGHTIDLPLPKDYNFQKKLFPKNGPKDVVALPIRCCVSGQAIIGVQYGDFPPSDPEVDLVLPVSLTPTHPDLEAQTRRADIPLYLSLAALVPAAFIFLQMLVGWFR
jgi:hypothetical protein